MPNREYICDNCDHSYETWQPLHEKLHKKCPKCKKNKLYQNLLGIMGNVNEPKTLGQLADLNTKKLGAYGLQERERREKEQANAEERQRAKVASEKTGMNYVAKCDLPASKRKKLDKEVEKKIFSGDEKTQRKKIDKYINTGEV